jgi:hypothetical protein
MKGSTPSLYSTWLSNYYKAIIISVEIVNLQSLFFLCVYIDLGSFYSEQLDLVSYLRVLQIDSLISIITNVWRRRW